MRGNERRHDQRDAQHVGHEKWGQALGRPQHFKKRRKPAPRHQGVGGQQRRCHCRRQQETLNQPTAEPVAFVKHLVGAHAQQDPASGRGHGDREPRCQWRRRRPALQRDQGYGEDADAKQQPARHLQLPERIVADGHPGRIFQLAFGPVEQPPVTADRSFPAALPRLVIGLEKIDAKIVLSRPLENLGNETRLIDAGSQRAVAHPPMAWPAGFADQNLLAGKGCRHLLANVIDMRGRIFGARRNVLPIRQEMGGDEIDILAHFAVTQPEFPDIGVGHRHVHARFDRADDLPQVGDGHLAAQQHFAADDDRGDRAGMILHQRDRNVGELGVLRAIASDPDAEQHLQSDPGRKLGHLVEPVVDGIGADTFGDLGQLRQILRDLLRTDDQRRIMRRLIAPERRVGNALQLRRIIDRRARQRHRRGQPPPHRGNHAQRYEEKRQRRAKADRPAPQIGEYVAYLATQRQPCRPADAARCTIAPRHGSGDIRPASNKKHQE